MNKETEFIRSVGGQDVFTESASEYVMPDYESDVRKILFSEAELRPAGKFLGADEVEFTGIVVYNVIYSDAEGKISGVSFNSDYRLTVKCPSEDIDNVFCEPRVTNFALRLLSPRKLSAKCSVCASVRMNERQCLTPTGDAFLEDGLETLGNTVRLRVSSASEARERELAEELKRLDGAIEDEVKVIYLKATPVSEAAEPCEDGVRVRGEIRMSALIENGDEPVFLAEKTVEVEETLPFDGINGDTKLIPEILVTSEKASVRADDDGCTVVADVICELSARGEGNLEIEVLSDAYLTSCPSDNGYSDYRYSEMSDVLSLTERHTAELNRSEIEEGIIREIPFVKAEPRLESVGIEEGLVTVRAEVKYLGIASEINDDGSISYSPIRYTAPFESNVKINCQNPEKITVEAKITACGADANMDANKIYLSSPLALRLLVTEDRCERILTECVARREEKYEKTGATVTVYYPEEGESLFDVAKRFHTSLERLSSDNSVAVGLGSEERSAVPTPKKVIIF